MNILNTTMARKSGLLSYVNGAADVSLAVANAMKTEPFDVRNILNVLKEIGEELAAIQKELEV